MPRKRTTTANERVAPHRRAVREQQERRRARRARDPNLPTHYLKMKAKVGVDPDDSWTRVAALWSNPDKGTVSVRLNKGVVLSWRDQEDYTLIIVPADDYDDLDPEIPF